ncbi:uncharacterized protein BYT42DRAFT_496167 [Radiomyces spectabilis]|uniref:uncharacterized protein n=1 Tax=Radiomyces spectabilis TaxID=64574 RepID=UPI00221FD757|nr:uncharacterized protein BYT42DRAFT_496167 [Radiomyces spectabilis]KAI8379413.1 hypothetical protein BYT42DRAFT_496167 [Radiomyces spectabilis]
MSSISSHEGSEKDAFFPRPLETLPPRYSYLRKTDLLDTLDVIVRSRDTDSWSVAATVDDQDSVISGHGGGGNGHAQYPILMTDDASSLPLESLREMDIRSFHDSASILTDEDKYPRSVAAECGDDGARSQADFQSDSSDEDEDLDRPVVVDDEIAAPPQPQPSFASVTRPYAELLEENEELREQIHGLQLASKHQAEVIGNLRALLKPDASAAGPYEHVNMESYVLTPSSHQDHAQKREPYIIVNTRTLTQQLARLAERLTCFARDIAWTDDIVQIEQAIFSRLVETYFEALPFGTENQHLLNTAYADQIRRFQSTLGPDFAKWYRRQTVQSLFLNHATKEYLQLLRSEMTLWLQDFLGAGHIEHKQQWEDILDLCSGLSLEIHAGDTDVFARAIPQGTPYNEEIMTVIGDQDADKSKMVKLLVSPLFIDEEQAVLLPARVILE